LGKGHADKLLAASEVPDRVFAMVALGHPLQSLTVDEVNDLRKDVAAGIHAAEPALKNQKFKSVTSLLCFEPRKRKGLQSSVPRSTGQACKNVLKKSFEIG
jgi:hypothetical protein